MVESAGTDDEVAMGRRQPTIPSEPGMLLTDLYQLTMLQAYQRARLGERAVFELFVRRLAPCRRFLVAAGLMQALDFLENARFSEDELRWLERDGRFDRATLEGLASWRFRGDVNALPEGTVFFADEPILQVVAPLSEAQLVETRLMNIVHFQTLIASKAARYRLAAPGKSLFDFGLRRAHGAEAGLLVARAAYLAGFDGSATVLAQRTFGVPAVGTMAHSFVLAHASEREAFRNFARAWPTNVVFLIDTYDTLACARQVPNLVRELAMEGITVRGVRLDSGDLDLLSRAVRGILDSGGCQHLEILASGGLDEHRVRHLVQRGAPIDGFGVGTDLSTSGDLPALDCAYKLVACGDRPTRKRSPGKATWPAPKQVTRHWDAAGRIDLDRLVLAADAPPGLLVPVMRAGRRVAPAEPLAVARERAATGLASLPITLRSLDSGPSLQVEIDGALQALALELDAIDRS